MTAVICIITHHSFQWTVGQHYHHHCHSTIQSRTLLSRDVFSLSLGNAGSPRSSPVDSDEEDSSEEDESTGAVCFFLFGSFPSWINLFSSHTTSSIVVPSTKDLIWAAFAFALVASASSAVGEPISGRRHRLQDANQAIVSANWLQNTTESLQPL